MHRFFGLIDSATRREIAALVFSSRPQRYASTSRRGLRKDRSRIWPNIIPCDCTARARRKPQWEAVRNPQRIHSLVSASSASVRTPSPGNTEAWLPWWPSSAEVEANTRQEPRFPWASETLIHLLGARVCWAQRGYLSVTAWWNGATLRTGKREPRVKCAINLGCRTAKVWASSRLLP